VNFIYEIPLSVNNGLCVALPASFDEAIGRSSVKLGFDEKTSELEISFGFIKSPILAILGLGSESIPH